MGTMFLLSNEPNAWICSPDSAYMETWVEGSNNLSGLSFAFFVTLKKKAKKAIQQVKNPKTNTNNILRNSLITVSICNFLQFYQEK